MRISNNIINLIIIVLFALGLFSACGGTVAEADDGDIDPPVTAAIAARDGDAATYHVDINGDDGNDGSAASPFRTVKYGASLLQAGDTLIIHPGDYGQEFEIATGSGTAVSPITIRAQTAGTVFLHGNRVPSQIDGGGIGFQLYGVSHIFIEGLHMSDYETAIEVDGEIDDNSNAEYLTITHSTFKNNGADGISNWKLDNLLVSDCTFISEEPEGGFPPDPEDWDAVQDYGVAIYYSANAVVKDSYFFGAHNQALSFKAGCTNGLVQRNIFEGALYTAIYLGQNRWSDGDNPKSVNLTAEYNIVRAAEGYRVKSPIRADNVENAIIRYNYFEGFDQTNNTSAVHIFDEVLGTIEVYDNIMAFGIANENSGGVALEGVIAAETAVSIHHNTIYSTVQDLFGVLNANSSFQQNISYQCTYYDDDGSGNFRGDPVFINGNPVQQPLVTVPTVHDFGTYYHQLTDPFRLDDGSPAQGFGVRFTNLSALYLPVITLAS